MSIIPSSVAPEPIGPVHTPVVREEPMTRPKMQFWDRIKVLMMIALVFAFLVAKQKSDIPIMSWGEAIADQLRSKSWLVALAGLEVLRQIHILISERSAAYNEFWQKHIWGAWNRRVDKMNPWLRYRINRAFRFAVFTVIAVCILGALWGVPPLTALAEAPSRLWDLAFGPLQGMPALLYIVFFMGMAILQFVAIFWFMSKGGVDTYMPAEVKTRFSDVWGQDHVLDRVQENIVFLEKPEEIESKGGHVPGGILLWGPPGTGKTLMAEAVAGETGRPYVFVDPGAFQAMFMGVGIMKVKALFRKLRKLSLRYGGVIVFFDEADSLGNRGGTVSKTPAPDLAVDAVFHTHLCSGAHHLSNHARKVLWDTMGPGATPADPAPKGGFVNRIVMSPGMGGGGMGTLQALLTELSGLKKPRGFFSRRLRQFFNVKPKQPPKYRLLVMMATNMPDSLDQALLRPGRIDRIYRVGYPSKEGRKRTYEGYFAKVKHALTDAQMDKLATITPYATGATIKDLVNESLIVAMREQRDTITWADVIAAKKLKALGPSENVEYIERERHATAIHEACHAVMAYRVRKGHVIDLATIEKGQGFLGMVSRIPLEERFTEWRTNYETDILVALASLAGERMFFGGDNSSGVSGDLESATQLSLLMEGVWGMGQTIGSRRATLVVGGSMEDGTDRNILQTDLGQRAEVRLEQLYQRAWTILDGNRREVLAVAHALEAHKTITGQDVEAIIEGRPGPLVDGRPYVRPEFLADAEAYHEVAAAAHVAQSSIEIPLPVMAPAAAADGQRARRVGAADARRGERERRRQRQRARVVSEPVSPANGWGVLHLFCKPTPRLDGEAVVAAVKACESAGHQVVTASMLGHKADLAFMALGPDWRELRRLQSGLQAAGLDVVDSYVSLTEVSEYAKGMPAEMLEARLHPNLPPAGKPAFCFYPMTKRREAEQNWYQLPYEDREELMREHGKSGRTFSGRVLQVITGSTGLDDYEWGVTLVRRASRRPQGRRVHDALRPGVGHLRRVRAVLRRHGHAGGGAGRRPLTAAGAERGGAQGISCCGPGAGARSCSGRSRRSGTARTCPTPGRPRCSAPAVPTHRRGRC